MCGIFFSIFFYFLLFCFLLKLQLNLLNLVWRGLRFCRSLHLFYQQEVEGGGKGEGKSITKIALCQYIRRLHAILELCLHRPHHGDFEARSKILPRWIGSCRVWIVVRFETKRSVTVNPVRLAENQSEDPSRSLKKGKNPDFNPKLSGWKLSQVVFCAVT